MTTKYAEYRLRGIPSPLWRVVRRKAGDDIQAVLVGLLSAYANGKIDPLSERDPVAAARGALGGQTRAANMTPEQRSAQAKHARSHRRDLKPRAETYRIEVKHEGRWVPAPGEATGWSKADAERAIAAGIPAMNMNGSLTVWDDVRMVCEEADTLSDDQSGNR